MQKTINETLFTVYLSKEGIELRPGCDDYPNRQALHTSKSYEMAEHFAQVAASTRNLPICIC